MSLLGTHGVDLDGRPYATSASESYLFPRRTLRDRKDKLESDQILRETGRGHQLWTSKVFLT